MPVINAQQTADNYPSNQPGTIITEVWNSRGGWFSVTGAAVFCQMQYGPLGSGDLWTEEVELGDGAFAYLDPKCTGVRFRSAVSGVPASITAQISQGDEPPLSIVALGNVAVVGLSLTFQHNDLAAGSEPIADFEDAAGVLTWTLTDDVANTRMKITPAFTNPALFPGPVGIGGNAGDTALSRLAAGVVGATSFSTGPTSEAVGGGGVTGQVMGPSRYNAVGALSTSFALVSSVTGDTQGRFTIDAGGTLSWGDGTAARDTSLARSAAVPPSSGQVGLATSQAFYSTNTTGGFVYAAAANNSAFLSFAAAADANPQFKVFTQGALEWGPGGASGLDLELARVSNSPSGTGTFLELLVGAGLGYGTGTGGTVTQLTSLTTGVTLNKPSGAITMFTTAWANGGIGSFVLTNSCIGAKDTVVVSWQSTPSGARLLAIVRAVAAGSCTIGLWNLDALTASAAAVLNFAVIKGATA